METSDIVEWLRAITRWVHVFAAILWIGQTYLFNWFEKNLTRDGKTDPNIVGNLWMVHGGGFYIVEKQKYPELMPRTLHWFKWEAAITWLSGTVLIALTYYAGGLLVEPEMNYNTGLIAGIGVILGGWVIYDVAARTPLGKNELVFAIFGLVALVGISYGLRRFLSTRAAYIHVGAMVGTIMAANVWMRILPAQRKMLAAAKEGKAIPPELAARGPQRSRHNTYMVVPLVFIMISNHYPQISYGNDYAWLILGVVVIVGWIAARIMRGPTHKPAEAPSQPAPAPAPTPEA